MYRKLILAGLLAIAPSTIYAAAITFTASCASCGASGAPDSAQADFTVDSTTGTVTIILTNLLNNNDINPYTAGSLLSGIGFTLTNAVTGPFNHTSTGATVDIAADKTYTAGASQNLGWALLVNAGFFHFDPLDGSSTFNPALTIIGKDSAGGYTGAGTYSNANGSIAGNGPHNPFAQNSVTLVVSGIVGLNAQTTINSATFYFGTGPTSLPGVPGGGGGGAGDPTPEPATFGLLGSALAGLAVVRWRRSVRK